MSNPVVCWGLEWNSESERHGVRRWIVHRDNVPALFKTRKEACEFRRLNFSYLAHRPDLRREPHGWQVPRVVRIVCAVKEVGSEHR